MQKVYLEFATGSLSGGGPGLRLLSAIKGQSWKNVVLDTLISPGAFPFQTLVVPFGTVESKPKYPSPALLM